ncbi:hypothetical protein BGZ65_013030, partial [Modicella reniformis]
MSFPGLVSSGAECGPSNSMNGLVKNFTRDRTLQQDRFASSSRNAGSSSSGFRTVRPGQQQGSDQVDFRFGMRNAATKGYRFSQEFLQQGGDGTQELLEFSEMNKELVGIHHQQQHHAAHPAQAGPDWARDFMQQNHHQQLHREPHNDTQFQEFESAFRNAQQQQAPQLGGGWQAEFALEQQHGGLSHTLQPEQIEAFERAFEDAKKVSEWESEFQAEHAPKTWAEEFTAQDSSMTDQDSKDALAKTAGLLLESVDTQNNEKFKNSSFMQFMRRLRDQEVAIEGNKLVEQTAPVAGSDWTDSFCRQDSGGKGKAKATDWSAEFESQQQQREGSTWSTAFEKRIEQHIKDREAGGMWSGEFAKQQEANWAEEFTTVTHVAGGEADRVQYSTLRQENAQDWVNEFNSANAADALEEAFQNHQQHQDQNENW